MSAPSEPGLSELDREVREAAERLSQAARRYRRAAGRPSPFLAGREVPDLEQAQIADAKVYANRVAMLAMHRKGGVVAEVGTETGGFAREILYHCSPDALHLFDLRFGGLAADVREHPAVSLHEGDSATQLAGVDTGMFDWMYIDGDHCYEGVKRDIEQAARTLKPGGVLVFNDYTRWSHLQALHYGIVPAVNELVRDGWRVAGFALSAWGYPDIAVRRPR